MRRKIDFFQALVAHAMRAPESIPIRARIERELVLYDILFSLDKLSLLDQLILKGGTSLRLCYGAPRFSEDLDFAGGINFDHQHLMTMKACLENYLGARYNLDIYVKEPNDLLDEPDNQDIKVNKWQIRITTHPERKDIPKQIIKIEIANIPAYTSEARLLAPYVTQPNTH